MLVEETILVSQIVERLIYKAVWGYFLEQFIFSIIFFYFFAYKKMGSEYHEIIQNINFAISLARLRAGLSNSLPDMYLSIYG